jgi:hypothetical protein
MGILILMRVIGARARWLFFLGRRSFKELYSDPSERNARLGFLVATIIVAVFWVKFTYSERHGNIEREIDRSIKAITLESDSIVVLCENTIDRLRTNPSDSVDVRNRYQQKVQHHYRSIKSSLAKINSFYRYKEISEEELNVFRKRLAEATPKLSVKTKELEKLGFKFVLPE